jgi:hypothetical protein
MPPATPSVEREFMKKSNFSVIAILFVGLALQACGNQNQGYPTGQYLYSNSTGQQTSGGLSPSAPQTPASTLQQQCASSPNVLNPAQPSDVTRAYRVCNASRVGGAQTGIAVFPEDRQNKQVCLFPLQQSYSGQLYPIVINAYAQPSQRYAVQCVSIPGTGATLSFGSTYVNAGYIVDAAQASTFSTCLAQGNAEQCALSVGIRVSRGNW